MTVTKRFSSARRWLWPLLATALLSPVPGAGARNIDLSTVPPRAQVELTIYNSEDLTLVREARALSFSRGANRLQFSWAGTRIDPTSVEIRFPRSADRLRVVDTTFPHDKPQMLYWNIDSELDGGAEVEISYFTSGLTWSSDYVMITNAAESEARLEGFIHVHNHSGEDYANARIRVVVGTINLVEKIAELARVRTEEVAGLTANRLIETRNLAARRMMLADQALPAGAAAPAREKQIISEGLSEYFIYTIEGTETVPTGWSKRLRSFDAAEVPIAVRYRYRPREYGPHLVRMYLTRNDEASRLGATPLPGGEVRIFRESAGDSLTYIAARRIDYVPVGDELELDLGPDPDVVVEREQLRAWREELWLRIGKGRRYQRVRDGRGRFERDARVAGWDEHALRTWRVRNFTGRAIICEIRLRFDGDATFASALDQQRHDFESVEFTAVVAAGRTRELLYEVTRRRGRNAKQNRLLIEQREVERPAY